MPSYVLRLLALPINSRTATQKPTLVYAIIASGYTFRKAFCRMHDITYPRASTVAQPLTIDRNFARISERQESARINAFLCMKYCRALWPGYFYIPPRFTPDRGFLLWRSAKAKLVNYIYLCKDSCEFLVLRYIVDALWMPCGCPVGTLFKASATAYDWKCRGDSWVGGCMWVKNTFVIGFLICGGIWGILVVFFGDSFVITFSEFICMRLRTL